MRRLRLDDIADQRAYERERVSFRAEVIELTRRRRISIGPLVTVVFENRTTMRFQVQEMARAERLTTDEQILHELEVYNPLIPSAGELSMTLFVELTNEAELREWLPKLVGIERDVVLTIGDGDETVTVRAAVDPAHGAQLTREATTASVHYVRLRLTAAERRRFLAEHVQIAIEHPNYSYRTDLPVKTKASLAEDWKDA
ncbi:MAG TPA: DUF3501 family protein [Acidimicrobiales bacterium]|nr:DUF3501 family protein [Acidimicrobiales bacterium]